jgi:pentatricopeptide repeat protein
MSRGTALGAQGFDLAFTQGWTPIHQARKVGRLNSKDLVNVLSIASTELRKPRSTAKWSEVKELVLWLAGERDMPGVREWCWGQLQDGTRGPERVVEVWKSILAEEQWKLREGDDALDHHYKKDELRSRKYDQQIAPVKAPASIFAAYVVAESIIHTVDSPPFSTLVHSMLASPIVPRHHFSAEFRSAVHQLGVSPLPLTGAQVEVARAWLRQTSLAQSWGYGEPGIWVAKETVKLFRKGEEKSAWVLWESIREGMERDEVKWIGEDWEATKSMHRVDDVFESDVKGVAAVPAVVDVDETAVRTTPVDAKLTQALVAPFLAGFAFGRSFDHANQIWSWLASWTPPLVPGVVVWTGLLKGYARRGDIDAAKAVWRQMTDAGVKPDLPAWTMYASAFFEGKQPDLAMEIVKEMFADKGIQRSLVGGHYPLEVYRSVMTGMMGNGRLEEARVLVDDMTKDGVPLDIRTVNVFLAYYTRTAKPDFPAIVHCLQLIVSEGLEADVFTFTMVLQALLTTNQRDAPAKLVRLMEQSGIKLTVTTYGTIINNLVKSGEMAQLKASVALLDEMERSKFPTNEKIYTSIILGFLRAGQSSPSHVDHETNAFVSAALVLKTRMESRGIAMNRIGYTGMISAMLGLKTRWGVEQALLIFRESQSKRLADLTGNDGAKVGHGDTWLVLLDGFARMGEWKVARALVQEMESSNFVPSNTKLKKVVDTIRRGGYNT